MLKKRTSLLKIFVFIIVITLLVLFVLSYQFSKIPYMTKTADFIKGWIQPSSVQQTNSNVEETVDLSVIKIKDSILIDAPVINQLPELPRGCEVTSLAMLLQYANVQVDKMTLAKEIKKDLTPYIVKEGKIYFGNPHDGFVGSMYTYDKPGLGVYHEPIKELADSYLPGQVLDLTGGQFKELKTHLSDGRPVWVIINTTYKKLPKEFFQTWHTPSGLVNVTFKEHSVLITGYDKDYVYFNDPLTGEKNKKAPKKDFEESWVQMGSQAITFLPR